MGSKSLSWTLLIVLALIWGSSFILMKKGMFSSEGEILYTSNQVAAFRIFFASLVLSPIAIPSLKFITKQNFIPLLTVGVCGNFLPAFLFTYAETKLNHSIVGVLNSTTPIFAILIGLLFFKVKIRFIHIIGICISTIGLFGLIGIGAGINLGDSYKYIIAVLLATVCYATSLNVIKHYFTNIPPIKLTALAFFLVLIPASFILLFIFPDSKFKWDAKHQEGILYILILGIIGTSIAVILFNKLIQISTTIFASSVTYLIPIIALLWGIVDHENVNLMQVFSMLIIITGVLLINRKTKKSNKFAE